MTRLSYEQGRADAFASLSIGVASTKEGATVVVMSKDWGGYDSYRASYCAAG